MALSRPFSHPRPPQPLKQRSRRGLPATPGPALSAPVRTQPRGDVDGAQSRHIDRIKSAFIGSLPLPNLGCGRATAAPCAMVTPSRRNRTTTSPYLGHVNLRQRTDPKAPVAELSETRGGARRCPRKPAPEVLSAHLNVGCGLVKTPSTRRMFRRSRTSPRRRGPRRGGLPGRRRNRFDTPLLCSWCCRTRQCQ